MSDMVTDDLFAAYAQQAEKEAQERASRQNSTPGTTYEQIHYTGLETGSMKIIRAVGPPPDTDVDEFTARTARVSWIVGDNGKKFRCILPEAGDDPDHVLWRIINRVKAVEYVDNKRVFSLEKTHKPIFDIVAHNGFPEGSPQYRFDKGWVGQQRLLMNVIDREKMDWHSENKHTMLLSRNIGQGKDGTLFPEEGVPSYGFTSLLANLFRYYKSWEKYDIGIVRTGQMEAPYRIINASKYLEEVPEHLQSLIIPEPLSEEEAEWARYDLKRLFGVTRYTKIHNRLKLTVARIDAALGTRYAEELEYKAEEERKNQEGEGSDDSSGASATTSIVKPEIAETEPTAAPSRPVPPRRTPTTDPAPSSGFDTSALKGWDKLAEAERALITGVRTASDGTVEAIEFADKDAVLLACPQCGVASPDSIATACPACGLAFS